MVCWAAILLCLVCCYGYGFCPVIGRVLCTRWRHDSPCYPCLSETLDVFYINILHIITRPPPDTLLLYPPAPPLRSTYLEPPTTCCLTPPLVRPAPVNNPGRVYITPCFLSHLTVYHQPLKMEPIQGSETSANYNLRPGKYPKEHIQRKWNQDHSNRGNSSICSTSVKGRRFFSFLHRPNQMCSQ